MARRIYTIANHKGGVGKTTSAANLAGAFARMGLRALMIDLDSQTNLTSHFLGGEIPSMTVLDALEGRCPLPTVPVGKNLALAPGDIDLAAADMTLADRDGKERLLGHLLSDAGDAFDYAFIDCPPYLGLLTLNALAASTDVLIPLTGEAFPLRGLATLDGFIGAVRERMNPALRLGGVFVTRYNNRSLNRQVSDAIRERYQGAALRSRIRECIALAEAPLRGKTIFDYAPESNGAWDYEALALELLERKYDEQGQE